MIQQKNYFNNLDEFLNSSLQSHQVLHIDLNHKKIGDQGASSLGSALAKCINLSNLTLILSRNKIGDEGESSLSFALKKYTYLSNLTLNLYDNKIGDQGASGLGSALAKCTNLSSLTLNLNVNKIGDEGTSGLGTGLAKCTNLSNLTLNLCDNKIGDQGAIDLGSKLEKCIYLSNLILNLSYNIIGDQGATGLSSVLEKCTNLSNLIFNLSNNNISDQGTSGLGFGLAKCTNLTNLTLHLCNNNIGRQGASGLGSTLAKCTNLSNLTLDFEYNQIGNEGALDLGLTLQKCINLSNLTLSLTNNNIGDEGVIGLGSALANCFNLQNLTLNLYNNNIGDKSASGLGSALAKCNNLSNLTLHLSLNQICDEGGSGLGSSLAKFTNLSKLSLNLSYNKIGTIGAQGLGFGLAKCTKLSNLTLDITSNQIDDQDVSGLCSALAKSTNLSNFTIKLSTICLFSELNIPQLEVQFSATRQNQKINLNEDLNFIINYDQNYPSDILSYAGALLYDNDVVGVIKFDYYQVKFRIWNYFKNIDPLKPTIQARFSVYNPTFIMPSLTTISFNINFPPQNCTLVISPLQGIALQTVFSIQFLYCIDEDLPLTYQFFYYNSIDDAQQELISPWNILRRQIQDQTTVNSIQTVLPQGNLVIMSQVIDSQLGVYNQTQIISIQSQNLSTKDYYQLVNQLTQQTLSSTNLQATSQLITLSLIGEDINSIIQSNDMSYLQQNNDFAIQNIIDSFKILNSTVTMNSQNTQKNLQDYDQITTRLGSMFSYLNLPNQGSLILNGNLSSLLIDKITQKNIYTYVNSFYEPDLDNVFSISRNNYELNIYENTPEFQAYIQQMQNISSNYTYSKNKLIQTQITKSDTNKLIDNSTIIYNFNNAVTSQKYNLTCIQQNDIQWSKKNCVLLKNNQNESVCYCNTQKPTTIIEDIDDMFLKNENLKTVFGEQGFKNIENFKEFYNYIVFWFIFAFTLAQIILFFVGQRLDRITLQKGFQRVHNHLEIISTQKIEPQQENQKDNQNLKEPSIAMCKDQAINNNSLNQNKIQSTENVEYKCQNNQHFPLVSDELSAKINATNPFKRKKKTFINSNQHQSDVNLNQISQNKIELNQIDKKLNDQNDNNEEERNYLKY
ncbi:REJ domain protein (macronuclear) [Tetrahymena thermophila SB210]|uniref:REJ domain protein n=1 Tax=Tetrahymena thermophila (strain SB210) TaxID=312017 RepID=Q23LR3_TETTS|nr:REJ domain protein [Tetrahymena thermophila SB210]EAR97447.2 REJ domain protein [Tetrahymena thermophila SB210]|eukprot:XP_001017692.2 REJ domain protein [Tetrahymena thermophila SB210]